MTIPGASLRACAWIWLASMLALGCGEVRTVTTMPAGSRDAAVADAAGSDAGPAAPEVGPAGADASPGMPDVSPGMPDVGSEEPDVGPQSRDATVDVPAVVDATGPDASVECPPTSHICGGACVSRIDVAHCGNSCIPCP